MEKNKKSLIRFGVWIVGFVLLFYFVIGNPAIYRNNKKLATSLSAVSVETVSFEEVVPFAWSEVYQFSPYTPRAEIEEIIGTRSPAIQEGVSEGMTMLVFLGTRGEVVASVTGYPENLGYHVDASAYVTDSEGDYYAHWSYGDNVKFSVEHRDGINFFVAQ